jgi:hypothetical protein
MTNFHSLLHAGGNFELPIPEAAPTAWRAGVGRHVGMAEARELRLQNSSWDGRVNV